MAQPSSVHDRTHRSSSHHHHHRTISSTTLLLALSLILAVLAITLTIPSYGSSTADPPAANPGVWNYLSPRRAQGIVTRESSVAAREAEVARREAELLMGSPAGVAVPIPTIAGCPPWPGVNVVHHTQTVTVEVIPTSTVVKEVVKEVEAIGAPPSWRKDPRVEGLYEREQRVAEREKDVGLREETVSKREGDASRRETWIMDQLINLGNDRVVEEEVVYEAPGSRRKPKAIPNPPNPSAKTEYLTRTVTSFEPQATVTSLNPILIPTHTVTTTVAMPSSTRLAAQPAPEVFLDEQQPHIGRTKETEFLTDETLAAPIPARTLAAVAPEGESFAILDDDVHPIYHVRYEDGELYDDEDAQYEEYEDVDREEPYRTVRRRVRPPPPPKKWRW